MNSVYSLPLTGRRGFSDGSNVMLNSLAYFHSIRKQNGIAVMNDGMTMCIGNLYT